MVMGYILAALLVVLEVAGILVAVLLGVILMIASLPAKFHVSGSLHAEGLIERFVDDGDRLVFRVAGEGDPGEVSGAGEVPVDVAFSLAGSFGPVGVTAESGGRPEVSLAWWRFRPGAGRRAQVETSGAGRGASGTGRTAQAGKAKRDRGFSLADVRKWLAPEVRQKVFQTLKTLFSALHLWTDLDVECGFADRGYTGMAYAAYVALGYTGAFGGIRFRPRFDREVLNAQGSFGLRVVPIQVAWIAGKLLMAREVRPLWWTRAVRRRKAVAAVKAAQ